MELGERPALLEEVYAELRAIAGERMAAERAGHTLQATALVHEAWLRLAERRRIPWQNRAHFYAAAVEAMRRVLIDHARGHGRHKRGGGVAPQPLESAELGSDANLEEVVSLDEAIRRLSEQDAEIGRVFSLRYYVGLDIEETAAALGISAATVKRRCEFARAWLQRELGEGSG